MKIFQLSKKTGYLLSAGSASLNLGLLILSSLVTAPMAIKQWGVEGFSISVLLASVAAYISILNFGMVQGAESLMNITSSPMVRKCILWSSTKYLSIISLSIAAVLLVIYIFLKSAIFGTIATFFPTANDEVACSIFVFIILNILCIPCSLMSSFLRSQQLAFLDNLISTLLFPIQVFILWLMCYLNEKISLYIYLFLGSVLLVHTTRILVSLFLMRKMGWSNVAKSSDELGIELEIKSIKKRLFESSRKTLVVTGLSVFIWNADSFIISYVLGPAGLAAFNLNQRIFSVGVNVTGFLVLSLVPILARLHTENKREEFRSIYEKARVFLCFLGGLFFLGYISFAPFLVHAWVGDTGSIRFIGTLFFGLYAYIFSQLCLHSNILISLNLLKSMPLISFLEAFFRLLFAIILVRLCGVEGAPIAMTLILLAVPYWFTFKLVKQRLAGFIDSPLPVYLRHFLYAIVPLSLAIIIGEFFDWDAKIRFFIGVFVTLIAYPITSKYCLNLNINSFIALVKKKA